MSGYTHIPALLSILCLYNMYELLVVLFIETLIGFPAEIIILLSVAQYNYMTLLYKRDIRVCRKVIEDRSVCVCVLYYTENVS